MQKINNKNEVLFILGTLGLGGSSTSMINLLSLLEEKYGTKCDILLFHKHGAYVHTMERRFHILDEDPVLWFLACDKKLALRKHFLFSVFMVIVYAFLSLVFGKRCIAREMLYKWRAKRYSGMYRVVVAYQEESVTTFGSFIDAAYKVAWVHCDFDSFLSFRADGVEGIRKFYQSYDKVVCVSKTTRSTFLKYCPELSERCVVVYNAFMVNQIQTDANEYIVEKPKNAYVFLSIGRFVRQKRFDKVIDVAKVLKSEGIDFCWFIVGNGEQFDLVNGLISENGLDKTVVLVGEKKNPFPYYKVADYLVITSDYEAFPMVANEALILGTPVISTSLPSISEIIRDGENGVIARGMESRDIAFTIKKLVKDEALQSFIGANCKKESYNNEHILSQVYDMLRGN